MLMIGVTLSLGSLVSAAAVGQFSQAAGESSLSASIGVQDAGTLVGLVYTAVPPSPSCPLYRGVEEGTTAVVAVYDYGTQGFAPTQVAVNSSLAPGTYPEAPPGALTTYTVPLGRCAHPEGLSVTLAAGSGEVLSFAG